MREGGSLRDKGFGCLVDANVDKQVLESWGWFANGIAGFGVFKCAAGEAGSRLEGLASGGRGLH